MAALSWSYLQWAIKVIRCEETKTYWERSDQTKRSGVYRFPLLYECVCL